MGLTIHFELHLPALLTPAEAVERLRGLNSFAKSLPFREVGHVIHLREKMIRKIVNREVRPELLWPVIQHERAVPVHLLADGTQSIAASGERVDTWLRSPPEELIGFTVDPGDGCESLEVFVADNPGITASSAIQPPLLFPGDTRWHGSTFCKTVYAAAPARGGLTNFIRCHLAIIALLDEAQRQGFRVVVGDEGGYHDHRNVRELVRHVGAWNTLLAEIGDHLRRRFGIVVVGAPTRLDLGASELVLTQAQAEQVCNLIGRTNGSIADMEVPRG